MPNLLAMSFEGELSPSFDLRCLNEAAHLPDGWGLGYYPGGEPSASVLKEPAPSQGTASSELVRTWGHLTSSLFVVHIRRATWGPNTDANTQPFHRSWGGSDWLFAHAGSLSHRFELAADRPFQPVGATDTEQIFCEVMSRFADRKWPDIGSADLGLVRSWFRELGEHGSMTAVLTDGLDLVAYADPHSQGALHLWSLLPPYRTMSFGDDDLSVDLTKRGVKSRKGIVLATETLTTQAEEWEHPEEFRPIAPGTLVVLRQGALIHEVAEPSTIPPPPGGEAPALVAKPTPMARPTAAPVKRHSVVHRTVYTYANPVERSTHLLRLTPVHDSLQSLVEHEITVSVDGEHREYEDVFGNRARRLLLEQPYTELAIEARSLVEVLDTDPLKYHPLHARTSIPLVWMPWQRHMLDPYLLPPELPESQLAELIEYAMSFVKRNDSDLVDTLLDMNSSLYRDFEYRQGSTTLLTTPWDVYVHRRGVCQDFANLFICLARLLGMPARYACGYIYTGPKNPNQIQSEASHAWVQVYLPEVGWKGFDPTNGILTQTDHVRVAVGRNYVDATPTSGTIYVGGGPEMLKVEVRVEQLD